MLSFIIDFIIKNAKTYFSFKLLNYVSRVALTILGVAAVVLFVPFGQVIASFEGGENNTEGLITEESLKAEVKQMEKKMLENGSRLYASGYPMLGQEEEFEDGFGGEELSANIIVQGNAFLGAANPSADSINNIGIFGQERDGVITYEVQTGDTISYIAASFGISTNTLLWANNLSSWSLIKPGRKLVILPVSGVLHEVKKNENLAKIAKDYKADFDEVISYNGLPADGSIKAGQKIIVPGGVKQIVVQSSLAVRTNLGFSGPYSGKSHAFPWGQCTWYVAQVRYIPWSGNAKQWLANAKAHGFSTGKEPQVGAIVATNETWYGHVAYVEAVNGDKITISEMSLGKGKLGYRTLNINDRRIRGYIY